MKREALYGALFLASVVPAASQRTGVGTWESHTAMSSVRSVAVQSGIVHAATAGGLFTYNPNAGTFTRVTNADGLTTNDLTAVGIDGEGRTWVGASDGAINTFDPDQQRWLSINNIRSSNKLQKKIQRFRTHGDTVFVVSAFGVLVFRTSRWEFGDAYSNFGFVTAPEVLDVAIAADSVWVATSAGVARASLQAVNLSAPTAWSIFDTARGLPSNEVRSLDVVGDTLLVGTTGGLVVRSAGTFVVQPAFADKNIRRIIASQTGATIYSLESGFVVVSVINSALGPKISLPATSLFQSDEMTVDGSNGNVWLATTSMGVATYDLAGWRTTQPNGPASNLFISLGVDQEGDVWASTGINTGGRGFTHFTPAADEGQRWKNFSAASHPVLQHDDYYKTNIIGDGSVWVSSWGKGAVKVVGDSVVRRIDELSSPALSSSVSGPTSFVVVGSIVPDADGRPWFVNRTAVNGNMLARLDADSTFTYFRNMYNTGEGQFTSMVIDRFGTKWLANSEPMLKAQSGLYYFNESTTLPGTQFTGGWGLISQSEGLTDNHVMSLAVDLEGDVWAGTDLGVTIFNDPSDPRIRRTSSFPLREQSIQTIAVDALNNKWVGTKEGVFVVSPDGAQLLEQYTVNNTGGKLIANDIRSIVIDQRTGIVYMGSEVGLSTLQIAAVQTSRTLDRLAVGPNPFVLPSPDPLTIRNLVPNSTIKILQLNGNLVAQFAAQGGGRAFWDGRNMTGSMVTSGTYMIVAYSENGEQVTTGKVAVIRR